MRDSNEHRIKVARGGVLMFVLTLSWIAWQNAGLTPVSAETPSPTIVPVVNNSGAFSSASASPAVANASIRLEWFSHCDPAQNVLGLYMQSDGACSPSRTATLAWLQSQLTLISVISPGDYLQRATTPGLPACGALVVAASGDTPVGWICSDARGLYRTNLTGTYLDGRWQLQVDGRWISIP